jgi:hypothetical protein
MTIDQLHAAIDKGSLIEDADLSSLEWKDRSCAGATFLRCRFIGCRFAHVDFRGASFTACIFTDKVASRGAVFAFSELREARSLQAVRDRGGSMQSAGRALQRRRLQSFLRPQDGADQSRLPPMQPRCNQSRRYPSPPMRPLGQQLSRGRFDRRRSDRRELAGMRPAGV